MSKRNRKVPLIFAPPADDNRYCAGSLVVLAERYELILEPAAADSLRKYFLTGAPGTPLAPHLTGKVA